MNNEVLIVKKHEQFFAVFYSDGKHVIIKDDINKYKMKVKNRYKNPIVIEGCYLYPSKTIKDNECIWINVKKFKDDDIFFNYLLEYFNLYETTKKMYMKQMNPK